MFWIVLTMTMAVVLAMIILASVALPARRAHRPFLTSRGERTIAAASDAARSVPKPPLPKRSKSKGSSSAGEKVDMTKQEGKAPSTRAAERTKKSKNKVKQS